jgi:SET domain-containing protein
MQNYTAIWYSSAMSDMKKGLFSIRRAGKGLGFGLFARRQYKRGEFVAEYTGRRISTKEADALSTRYLFEIDENWTVDGSPRSNIARYMNHSCDPNCEADIVDGKILISAIRDIEVGEELTFDYGDEYFDEFIKPIGCRCSKCVRSGASYEKASA